MTKNASLKRKGIRTGWSIITVLAVAILFSCQTAQQADDGTEETFGATSVKVFPARNQTISERIIYTGLIEAWRQANILPDVGGKIAKIYTEEGSRVRKGQLLAELDTRAADLQMGQARAALAVAEANFKDAKRNMERMERLSGENAISEQQLEKISLAFEAAEAQKQQAQAAVYLFKHQLDVSRMVAPFSGVIAARKAEVGDMVNPMMGGFSSGSGVFTLMDFSRIKINISASHQDIVRIRKGQIADFTVSALPDQVFEGKVAVVNMTADPMTRKFDVQVYVDNPDLNLRPNTFGEVSVRVSTHDDALVIPQNAVLDDTYVFVIGEDGAAKKRSVTLGLQDSAMIEILSGLKAGENVVVEGNFGLEEGDKLEISEVLK
jgi:RND family efflux transporter MFP subunit